MHSSRINQKHHLLAVDFHKDFPGNLLWPKYPFRIRKQWQTKFMLQGRWDPEFMTWLGGFTAFTTLVEFCLTRVVECTCGKQKNGSLWSVAAAPDGRHPGPNRPWPWGEAGHRPWRKRRCFPIFVGEVPKIFAGGFPPKKEQDVVLRVGLCHLGVVYFLKIRATKLGSERPEVPNTIIPKPLKFQRIYGFLSTKNWGVNHWKIAVALLHLFHGSMVFKSKYTYVLHIHI